MRKNIRPSFLDPRTKILIWLLANVVVFTWSPAVFQLSVMVAYLILFLVERKGTMLAGLLATYLAILAIQYWLLPLLPGSLATVFATVWALHVISAILKTGIVSAMAPGLEIGRGHHLLFHLAQRCIPHEVACHWRCAPFSKAKKRWSLISKTPAPEYYMIGSWL